MAADHARLVAQARAGDRDAFAQIMQEHLPGLRAYIRLRMGPRVRRWETESDMAQSVCVEALQQLDDFDYRGESAFRQWLFTAALRKIVEKDRYLSAEKRDTDHVETNAVGARDLDPIANLVCHAFGSPSEYAQEREMMGRIERALDRMSEAEREVILMSRLAGRSTKEIGEHLDRTESAVRALLVRALASLARHLTTGCERGAE